MPSDRRQFNVRMSDETAERVDRLMPAVSQALGLELSQSQFFALAITALEEKHGGKLSTLPPVTSPASEEPEPKKPAAKKGKK